MHGKTEKVKGNLKKMQKNTFKISKHNKSPKTKPNEKEKIIYLTQDSKT